MGRVSTDHPTVQVTEHIVIFVPKIGLLRVTTRFHKTKAIVVIQGVSLAETVHLNTNLKI